MCGLFALVREPCRSELTLCHLFSSLAHRGPDDRGWQAWTANGLVPTVELTAANVLLGHTRLAILDLSPDGRQPMATPDGRWHIVYNGEIYNYLELRGELEGAGVAFKTRTDTEVLLAAFARWGIAALARLEGMFAFVVLDRGCGRLYAVRDAFGIKPLFWCRWRDGLAFASEIPTLLELPGLGREPDPGRVFAYLRFGDTDQGRDTLFAEVHQLEPGSIGTLHLTNGAWEERRWWRPSIPRTRASRSFPEATERLRAMFLDNVQRHLRSDVSVGVCLSGGIDSSAIACCVRRLEPDIDLLGFSFIDEDPAISEERWVDLVTSHAKVQSCRVTPGKGDLQRDLSRLIRCQGEPFGSTSIYAQYRVFALAREHGVKVVLEGQGADEVLAGYLSYQGARLASLLRQGRGWEAWGQLHRAAAFNSQRSRWLLLQFAGMALLPPRIAWLARRLVGREVAPGWLDAGWLADHDLDHHGAGGGQPLSVREHLQAALVDSIETSLVRLLRYGDRNAMAFSIENRVPFLTIELVEFLLSLPEAWIIGEDGESKRVFRAAMRGIVPDPVLDRHDKIGFTTSQSAWMAGSSGWVEERMQDAASLALFSPDGLARLDPVRDSAFVWRICNLVDWAQAFAVPLPSRTWPRPARAREVPPAAIGA